MTQIPDTEYMKVVYTTDSFKPVIMTRTIERRQTGTWLFGLLPVYEYYYSAWKQADSQ
jgi:hypothetical protein